MRGLIIIPAYNEEKSIASVFRKISSDAPDFDILVVNDCSTDGTLKVCRDNGIHVLNLPVNLGIGGAVQTGYRYAYSKGYDLAVQMDGDGQHDPLFLPEMLKCLTEERADMVIGSRFINNEGYQSSHLRRIGIRYFSFLIKLLTGEHITDPTSGFRMVNRRLIEGFSRDYPGDYPEPESLTHILKQGCTVKEVPVRMKKRQGGVSSIRYLKSLYYMTKVTTAVLMEAVRIT